MAASTSVAVPTDPASATPLAGSFHAPATPQGEQEALDNNANNFSPPSDVGKRRARYARRALLWDESKDHRQRNCGRGRHASEVGVRLTSGVAGFAGVKTCGKVWTCPVCNAKIMARRSLELGSALAMAQLAGLRTAFLTFTLRHHAGQSLTELWDAIAKGWNAVTSGAPWIRAKGKHGIVGWVRVVECTEGCNGWHPHVHVVIFFDREPDLEALHAWMFERWARRITKLGFDAPLMGGQDARMVESQERVGQYLAKAVDTGTVTRRKALRAVGKDLGQELTNTQAKTARDAFSTRTPWELLDSWFGEGDFDASTSWLEFEKASSGRRQIAWSRGLRELLGLALEKSDEEIAAEELGTKDDDLVRITARGWAQVVKAPELMPAILSTAEKSGLAGLRRLLDVEGVEYVLAGQAVAA